MRLKVLTTAFLVLGLLLMLAWPIVVGPRPDRGADRVLQARWGQRVLLYFGATAGTWVVVAGLAWLTVRQARREILELERQNVRSLIEATLKDHRDKQG